MEQRKFWNPEMETLPTEELRELQLKKLKKLIRYCYDNSPLFYRKKLDALGIKPEDIQTWNDFYKLPPLVNKEEHRKAQEESLEKLGHPYGTFLCAPLEKVTVIHSTSGTTGDPTFYPHTKKDEEVMNEVWCRIYWRAGIRPGDTVLHTFGLSMWMAGIPVINALRHLGARPIPVGGEVGSERILRLANITKPNAIVGTPSMVEHLIERCPQVLGKEVKELGIKRIVCTGAPGAGIPAVRKKIEEAYGCKLYDSAGGGLGIHMISCDWEEYQGMHVVSEDLHIWCTDLIDPVTKEHLEIKDGVIGEGMVTSLEQEAAPYLKYAFGDLLQVFTERCPCGLEGRRVKFISRVDDMIIVKGVNVYPTAVKNVIAGFHPKVTGEMRIVLDEPPPLAKPPVKIKVEHGEGLDEDARKKLKQDMEEKIKGVLSFRADIELVPPMSLPRVAGPTGKGELIEKRYEKK